MKASPPKPTKRDAILLAMQPSYMDLTWKAETERPARLAYSLGTFYPSIVRSKDAVRIGYRVSLVATRFTEQKPASV